MENRFWIGAMKMEKEAVYFLSEYSSKNEQSSRKIAAGSAKKVYCYEISREE